MKINEGVAKLPINTTSGVIASGLRFYEIELWGAILAIQESPNKINWNSFLSEKNKRKGWTRIINTYDNEKEAIQDFIRMYNEVSTNQHIFNFSKPDEAVKLLRK